MNESTIFNIGRGRPTRRRLLWTNDDPYTAVRQFEINLSNDTMETYKMFQIIWSNAGGITESASHKTMIINEIGLRHVLCSVDGLINSSDITVGGWRVDPLYRDVNVTDSGLVISGVHGYSYDASTVGAEENTIMPLYIYGIE